MPEMGPVILSLVQKLHRGEFKDTLIEHLAYRSVIEAVGGEKDFAQMALNAIDPRVLALQGKIITVEMLDRIRASQMQELDPWPHSNGGYCDFITDSRDTDYWRGYVGQASVLAIRIPQHCSAIRVGKNNTLHYHIVTNPSAAGYRYGNFIRLELAPRVRGEFTKLLEGSTDPEIREWPSIRAQQKHQPNASAKNLVETQRCPRLSLEENINALYTAIQSGKEFAEMVFWPSKEKIPWAPHGSEIQPLDLKAWFEGVSNWLLKNHCTKSDLAILVGTTVASVGIMLDSVPSHDYGEISLPWGLRESGFTDKNSLIWFASFQKYKLIPGTFQASMPHDADTEFFSKSTHELIGKSSLRVILLCGKLAEKIALTEQDLKQNFTLELQGVRYEIWLRLRHHTIERIFVRSPAPLIKLWSNKGSAAVKIDVLFRFVSAVSSTRLSTTFYESALTVALVIRGWDDERSQRIDPLELELGKVNPTLRIWLERLGFREDNHVRRLAECTSGSLRLGLLVLLKVLPRAPPGVGPRKIPQSKTRRRGVISPETMQKVRLLLKDVQKELISVPKTEGGDIIKPPDTLVSSEDTILVDEDLIMEAVEHGSVTIKDFDSKEERLMIDRLQKKTPNTTEDTNPGKGISAPTSSTFSTQLSESTRRLQIRRFFVKAEVAPVGKRHPHAYATSASETDPGMRFGFRVSLRDDKGEDSFVEYASSSTWQAIAIANSFVDGLDGDSFEEICRRKRRFVWVDKRIKNVPSELRPFVNEAYRDDENNVVRFNSASPKVQKPA
ncbi:uncharacterized protein N7479_002032 [Penicillium vulpinum]|uniref:uncharacterized protein n=1 Tax=Penicillium vulpinum TaxID=29845 RepID=UPI0025471A8D|nr:uncharacterized protein N7479_002032 [Penicillium vulpinum]KAJ5972114.1 hypothetical protein N7479_002032 [Penicillium vulpinum]